MTNTPMTSREAFEKWAEGLVCFALENEEYIDPNTHLLWCLFKEKTQTIVELVEALERAKAMVGHEDNIAIIDAAIAKVKGQNA